MTMNPFQHRDSHSGTPAHFKLDDDTSYRAWRQRKLDCAPKSTGELMVPIRDALDLCEEEAATLRQIIQRANMVIYRITHGVIEGKEIVRNLGQRLGLLRLDANICADEDGITSLQVVEAGRHRNYIPYTNRALSWHTDGYYNTPTQQIRALVMHCVQDAEEGGESMLLDPEIAYIHLRDTNPAYITALMHPQAMTIPPNTEEGVERAAQSGPVFSIDPLTQSLHMRYSARKRNIVWRDDLVTSEAVACLNGFLSGGNSSIMRYTLRQGEGVICNNVLHNRTAFTDSANVEVRRLLYRARYYDRVRST